MLKVLKDIKSRGSFRPISEESAKQRAESSQLGDVSTTCMFQICIRLHFTCIFVYFFCLHLLIVHKVAD